MGVSQRVREITGNVTLDKDDAIVFADSTGGAITITLPAANAWGANSGGFLSIKKKVASVNAVTVQRAGADTLNGGVNETLADNTGKEYASDGVNEWQSY